MASRRRPRSQRQPASTDRAAPLSPITHSKMDPAIDAENGNTDADDALARQQLELELLAAAAASPLPGSPTSVASSSSASSWPDFALAQTTEEAALLHQHPQQSRLRQVVSVILWSSLSVLPRYETHPTRLLVYDVVTSGVFAWLLGSWGVRVWFLLWGGGWVLSGGEEEKEEEEEEAEEEKGSEWDGIEDGGNDKDCDNDDGDVSGEEDNQEVEEKDLLIRIPESPPTEWRPTRPRRRKFYRLCTLTLLSIIGMAAV
ncbi:MAG: hypothetical protein Q9225_006685, partial [Loekoesia sp. 1 TL-2023]